MTQTSPAAEIVTIACLQDNYAFLLHDTATGATAVIDVPETGPIEAALSERGWHLSDILITHHHGDHIDGVDALRASTGAAVWGAGDDADRLPALDHALAEGDEVRIGNLSGGVLDVSGHCQNHLAFDFPEAGAVFTADSLMALGCGRIFEGTAQQMWDSLQKLAALPGDRVVCSGHEYTATNARFALTIEPDNPALKSRAEAVKTARENGRPTVPSTLAEELATNPFLRAGESAIADHLDMGGADPVEVFARIRSLKDRF